MKRFLFLLVFVCALQVVHAQYIYTIKADSVKITNSCDTAELIIENHTQTVPGFLYNKGRGRTEFRRAAIKLNEGAYLIGADTLFIPKIAANNGVSFANGNLVLGNDPGSTAAQLMNTREIPLNGNNVVFTGTGKIGIGANNPRDLLELGTPIARFDTATANLRFTYTNEPIRYTNVIWNRFSGDSVSHSMGFSLTNQGSTTTPLVLSADSKIYLTGHVICSGGGTTGAIDLQNNTTFTNANMIVLRSADGFHYHVIKASYNGAWPQENKMQFYLYSGGDTVSSPTANPLNLLGNGNSIFNGSIGVQNTAPSAHIHVGAGTSASGTAPIKLTSGDILATPEGGTIEYDGADFFFTDNTTTRYKLAKTLSGQLTTSFGGVSLTAFNHITTTLTIAGAQPGDLVNVSASTVNQSSIIISAYVTSANTVTLQAYNASNSAVTIASDTYKVRVIK